MRLRRFASSSSVFNVGLTCVIITHYDDELPNNDEGSRPQTLPVGSAAAAMVYLRHRIMVSSMFMIDPAQQVQHEADLAGVSAAAGTAAASELAGAVSEAIRTAAARLMTSAAAALIVSTAAMSPETEARNLKAVCKTYSSSAERRARSSSVRFIAISAVTAASAAIAWR